MLTTQLLSFLTHVGVALVGILALASVYVSVTYWTRRRLPPTDSTDN